MSDALCDMWSTCELCGGRIYDAPVVVHGLARKIDGDVCTSCAEMVVDAINARLREQKEARQ